MVVVTLSELLSNEEIAVLLRLYKEHKWDGEFAPLCRRQIIEPNLQRINQLTKQENDSLFLAYLLEATLDALVDRHAVLIKSIA